jgi:hypothetical protein
MSESLNLSKPEIQEARGKLPPVELMRELTRLCRIEGMPYHKAYRKIFPHRQQRLRTASTQAHLLVERYIRDHADDLREMLLVHGLNKERFASELDQRLKANTLREVVKSEVVKVKSKDGRTRPVVVTTRDTEEVEDNSTRMRATELLADVHGARKVPAGGGVQQNVGIIYVVGNKITKKRQERIV